MKRFRWVCSATMLLALAGCSEEEVPRATATVVSPTPLMRDPAFSVERVTRGAALYQEHCAQCHGPEAQGHPDWQNPEVAAAPPLNGTGNEWKRSRQELVARIKNGIERKGVPVMPAWKGRLSDEDVGDVIVWFQALWPADVYQGWLKTNAKPAGLND